MAAYDLAERFRQSISGFYVGNSFGALTKGMAPEKVLEAFGKNNDQDMEKTLIAAWKNSIIRVTEPVERLKLISQAVIEKNDRIRSEDLGKVWNNYLKPELVRKTLLTYEVQLLDLVKAGVPAVEIGRYCDYSGLNNYAVACLPVSFINACDPLHAKEDAEITGSIYQRPESSGIKWAAVSAIAAASAFMPGATADHVIETVFRLNDDVGIRSVKEILEQSLDLTAKCRSFNDFTEAFNKLYNAVGIPNALSFAKETVTKALCIFRFAGCDVEKAIVYSVATGRDSDSTAALAAALSGALGGNAQVPSEWIELSEFAESSQDTFYHYSAESLATALFNAFTTRSNNLQTYLSALQRGS